MSELTSNSEQLEYTPTTIEILEAYRSARTVHGINFRKSSFEFDRWLEQIQNEWYTKGFNAAHATFRR